LVNVTTPLSRIEVTCDMSGLTSRVGTVLLSGLQSSQTGAAPPQQGRRAPSPRLLRGGRPVAPVAPSGSRTSSSSARTARRSWPTTRTTWAVTAKSYRSAVD